LKRTLQSGPSDPAGKPLNASEDIEAFVSRMGGREALIRRLIGDDDLAPEAPFPPAAASDSSTSSDIVARLCLDADELRLLDQAVRASKFTRNRWIESLVQKALRRAPRINSADRVDIAKLAKELRAIEAATQKSARALAKLEATARACLERFHEMDRFNRQVRTVADALDEVFRGNDAYWRALVDETDESEPKQANR
jgi:hypothetical protein